MSTILLSTQENGLKNNNNWFIKKTDLSALEIYIGLVRFWLIKYRTFEQIKGTLYKKHFKMHSGFIKSLEHDDY